MALRPSISILIASHNRRDVLLGTLQRLHALLASEPLSEILLVDNASGDGSADAVAARFPRVRLLRLPVNLGACAKARALPLARGRYVVFLDDDSCPRPGTLGRMVERFESDPALGAASFTITLPDGRRECSAYPDVFIGCGVGFRAEALRRAGGLDESLFMQAEEYDLSLRLLEAGYAVRSFDDLHATHLKTATARRSWRTTRLDVRNNLLVLWRHAPSAHLAGVARAWMARYWRLARDAGQTSAFLVGAAQAAARIVGEPWQRRPVRRRVFEGFLRLADAERCARVLRRRGVRRVLLLDWGKNAATVVSALRREGIEPVGIADRRLGGRGIRHLGLAVLSDDEALLRGFDAAVLANASPVHAAERQAAWQRLDARPVINPFAPLFSGAGRAEPGSLRTAARSA